MKKRHIGLCLTLLICNLALSDLKDFSPGIAFLTARLKQEEATLSCKNRLIEAGNEQNKKRSNYLITSGVATALAFIPSIIKGTAIYFGTLPDFATENQTIITKAFLWGTSLSKLGRMIAMGTLIYGAYLPHKDTESLEADVQLTQGTIKELKELLEALQTKIPCPQVAKSSPETPAPPEKEREATTEEPPVPAEESSS